MVLIMKILYMESDVRPHFPADTTSETMHETSRISEAHVTRYATGSLFAFARAKHWCHGRRTRRLIRDDNAPCATEGTRVELMA